MADKRPLNATFSNGKVTRLGEFEAGQTIHNDCLKSASDSVAGIVRYATSAEAIELTDTQSVVTPGSLKDSLDIYIAATILQATEVVSGIAKIATATQMTALTDNTTIVTPSKLGTVLSSYSKSTKESSTGKISSIPVSTSSSTTLDSSWLPTASNTETTNMASAVKLITPSNLQSLYGSVGKISLLDGLKNKFLNGKFDHWNRGTSFSLAYNSISSTFTADNWYCYSNVSPGAATISRFTLSATEQETYGCRYGLSYEKTIAGSSYGLIMNQKIPNVRLLSGKAVTVTGHIYASVAMPISIVYQQNYGSGGTPSTTTSGVTMATISLSAGWNDIVAKATLPSTISKTLGTANNDCTLFYISEVDPIDDYQLIFVNLQVTPGSLETVYENRPYELDKLLCQCYYETQTVSGIFINTTSTTTAISQFIPIQVKISTPTITINSVVLEYNSTTYTLTSSNYAVNNITQNGFMLTLTLPVANINSGGKITVNYSASC